MALRKDKLRRPCKRCEKMFIPSSRQHRLCYPCMEKAISRRMKNWKNPNKLVKEVI